MTPEAIAQAIADALDGAHHDADLGSPAGRAQDTADRLAAEARDYQWTPQRQAPAEKARP